MIIDLADEAAAPGDQVANVCVVGAGPAGISLALELARARPDWHILLVEAGGPDNASDREKDIYRVTPVGKSYSVLEISRRRKLGGTSAHWGGWSKPLDATDFESNPGWDVPAWPFGPEELAPWVPRALAWTDIEGDFFSVDPLRQRHEEKLLSLGAQSRLGEHLFRFSPPTRFGDRYRDDLAAQENLSCLLHANLYQLSRKGDRITGARVRSLDGASVHITADRFVLALGGMETTRYLLNLRGDEAADGDGIHSPHLGRYFADHYGLRPGVVLAREGLRYHRFGDDSGPVMPVLTFSASDIRQHGHHNCCMMLHARSEDDSLLASYGGSAALGFAGGGDYWHYRVQMIIEPRPNPASTLTLTEERCELGLRRMQLAWQPHPADFDSAYALFSTLGEELGRTGLGRSRLAKPDSAEVRQNVSGACHHLGTTRMAARSEDGVVDPDLKVYGTANLYVASSSVFPRYGYANPTLTIIALAARLARHLAGNGAGAAT
ncbi:GMC oxidoreductase [Kineobactrum salinum]|uniref:GMC family oxidoreductase n=1 Tax=Kineobactrum salinum TaxID=2708301 RepID=A0A6C0U2Q7_9GAMM|nr:GMC family oxidoreductase [Kineobactrum salinum]QIB66450.1 GMC family oxidoreductase [Kineobactrum salinum]